MSMTQSTSVNRRANFACRITERFAIHAPSGVSVSEDYEVEYFAKQNGITPAQVRELIQKVGNDRATLTAAAKALRPS